MAYIGNVPAEKYSALTQQTFSSPTGTSFTLDQSCTNSRDIALFIDNVRQNPASYTVSGTSLTTSTISSPSTMYCLFNGKTTETVNPPDDSVGLSQMASGTDGNLITFDASGNPAYVATGNDGQVLTSTGAGSPPAFEDAGGGGAWTFISSATASASSSVDFTSGINSTYDTYMLTITSLVASSSSLRPYLQVSVGGTFATANYHYYTNGYGSGGGAVDAGSAGGESMRLHGNTNMYSDTAKAGSGIIYFHNPASTTTYSNFHWKYTFWSATDVVMNDHGSGLYNGSTGAVDGVRLLAGASGNFTSGTFRLYGLAKS